MPPCTELHIPYKKWALSTGQPDAGRHEQNYLAIERWAREQQCPSASAGSSPQSWCASDDSTVTNGSSQTVVATISANTDYVFVTAKTVVTNTSGGNLSAAFLGYFYSDMVLGSEVAIREGGFTWGDGAIRSFAATCIVDAGSSVGVRISNSSGGDMDFATSVTVQEVDHQDLACCVAVG